MLFRSCQANMIIGPSISKRLEEEADKIPMEIAEQIAAIGTPSQVIETLESYKKLGATHFLIRLMGKDAKKNLKQFGSKVISVMN